MSQLMEYTQYLSQVIGPRPAGTEEEHQAALYITEQFQKETGFSATIEEFKQTTRPVLSLAILASIVALLSIAALFVPAAVIPLFILVAIVAAMYFLELAGHPLLSRALAHGRSQNVIAKYQPNASAGDSTRSITRKLVVVAPYDSGHALPSLVKSLNSFKISFDVLCGYVLAALVVLMFVRIFVAILGGGMLVVLNILTVAGALVALLSPVKYLMTNSAPYNEGANNNATGVAALIELAARISKGSVSEADLAERVDNVVIHGADAAQSEGLIPEGAELKYEAHETEALRMPEESQAPDERDDHSEQERLLAAKAAVAALTGRPVERRVYAHLDGGGASGTHEEADAQLGETVQMNVQDFMANGQMPDGVDAVASEDEADVADGEAVAPGAARSEGTGANLVEMAPSSTFPKSAEPLIAQVASSTENSTSDGVAGFQNAPSWFVAAQKNAKRPTNAHTEIHRSRYTEALEHAEQERIAHEQEMQAEEAARLNAEREQREAEARRALDEQAREATAARAAAAIAAAENETAGESAAANQVVGAGAGAGENAAADSNAGAGTDMGSVTDLNVRSGAAIETKPVAAHTEAIEAGAQEKNAQGLAGTALPRYVDDASVTRTASGAPELVAAAMGASAVAVSESGETEVATATAAEIFETEAELASNDGDVVPSRIERLKSLRTSIPSLSGVIRSKDAARKTAAATLPNPLDEPRVDMSASAAAAPAVQDSAGGSGLAGTSRAFVETDAHASLQATATASAAAPAKAASSATEGAPHPGTRVRKMVIPEVQNTSSAQFTGGLATTSEKDFATGLLDEADLAAQEQEGKRGKHDVGYRYDNYDNAFIDDEDFDHVNRKKRKGLFDRFRRNKDDEDDAMNSPQQWLGVDDDFEARSAGRARGGWESFRQDYEDDVTDPFNEDSYDDFGELDDEVSPRRRGRRWEGGSYSRVSLGRVDNRSEEDAVADAGFPDALPETTHDRFITGEIERIYHFRNPAFNTEIWFVAMGCDNDSHEGVRAFLNEHRSELRGSMVIELESLGAGELSVASHEGSVKKVSASTRIKRYTREAVAATGIPLREVDLSGSDSIASIIQEAGFQSMHLFGAEKGQIASKGSASDTFENVDEFKLEENIRFVYELLKR